MNSLADSEIKKALEICYDTMDCAQCPNKNEGLGCIRISLKNALDLINRKDSKIAELTEENNRQKEEIEDLNFLTQLQRGRKYYNKFVKEVFQKEKGNDLLYPDFDEIYKRYFEQKAEIERLEKHELKEAMTFNNETIKRAVNEAIEKFAERVKMAFYYEFEELIPSIMADKIDNLVKEMAGEG